MISSLTSIAQSNGLDVRHDVGYRQFMLKLRDADALHSGEFLSATGTALPLRPNSCSRGRIDVYWLSPDEWLLEGTSIDRASVDGIYGACRNTIAHLAEITDGLFRLTASGPSVNDLLAKSCSLDFHQRSFAVGECKRSLFAQVRVLLYRAGLEDFVLFTDTSYKAHLLSWIELSVDPMNRQSTGSGAAPLCEHAVDQTDRRLSAVEGF